MENERDSKLGSYIFAFISLVILLLVEFFLKSNFSNESLIPQIFRLLFIIVLTFFAAVPASKEMDLNFKKFSIIFFTGLGISIIIGVLPRMVEMGIISAIDLILLKENMFSGSPSNFYSFKSNFIVPFGYSLACWGIWCWILNKK